MNKYLLTCLIVSAQLSFLTQSMESDIAIPVKIIEINIPDIDIEDNLIHASYSEVKDYVMNILDQLQPSINDIQDRLAIFFIQVNTLAQTLKYPENFQPNFQNNIDLIESTQPDIEFILKNEANDLYRSYALMSHYLTDLSDMIAKNNNLSLAERRTVESHINEAIRGINQLQLKNLVYYLTRRGYLRVIVPISGKAELQDQ